MKILIDGIVFKSRRVGGVAKVWEEYLKRLCHHDLTIKLVVPLRKQHPFLTPVLHPAHGYEVRNDVFYWPARYFRRVAVRSKLLKTFYLDRRIDLFHSTYCSTIYSNRVRNVVTVHDMIPELFGEMMSSKWLPQTLDIRRRVFMNADHLIAISESTRKDLLRCYPALSPERVTVIYNGPTSYQHLTGSIPSLDDLNRQRGLRLDPDHYFLCVGKRRAYKNFKLLIELVRTYDRYKDIHVVCVGGEEVGEGLHRRLKEERLTTNFTFLGYVSDAELVTLYRHATALVYPSKYEGFGLPILEAMSNGCPVLCSEVSSLPEVGGDAALYFDPASTASLAAALDALRQTPREVLRTRGRQNVERFSWERATQQLVEVYQSLC